MTSSSLRSLLTAFERAAAHCRRDMGLGANEFFVLFHLWMGEPTITMGEMGRLVNVTSGGLTALVERLERGSFVARHPDPSDRRRIILTLSERGSRARDGFLAMIDRAALSADDLTAEERLALDQYLRHTAHALERAVSDGLPLLR